MTISELRGKNIDELKEELKALLRAQFSLRMQLATQQTNKTHELRKVGRDIARVHTLMGEARRKSAA
ncbi:MAG TPA: 50S ribosomal protein L29 [Thiobacillaceae bacterium]|nr:50S ribosomal protein L29 [Thiobacillaceae bacterium]